MLGDLAENVATCLAKGDRVVIVGRIEEDIWTGRDGNGPRDCKRSWPMTSEPRCDGAPSKSIGHDGAVRGLGRTYPLPWQRPPLRSYSVPLTGVHFHDHVDAYPAIPSRPVLCARPGSHIPHGRARGRNTWAVLCDCLTPLQG